MDAAGLRRIQERFRLALSLFEFSERALRARLRRERPDAAAEEIDAEVAAWLARRPGAELGDGEGTPVSWPRP